AKNAAAMARGSGYHYSAQPVCELRKHLVTCPDESAVEAGHELAFVSSPQLREDLRVDLADAYTSLYAGRFKAATVIAGSVIEALVVWRLSKLTPKKRATAISKAIADPKKHPKGSPEDWWFWQLIEVATAVPVISDKTAKQIRLAKDFRNLIHPG